MSTFPQVVSYAQQFEDVILWRALKEQTPGFYVDVGAAEPVVDSVGRLFYENGWRGVEVEPSARLAEALRRDRPENRVVEALVGSERRGDVAFHESVDPRAFGLSTADEGNFGKISAQWPTVERRIASMTLDDLFAAECGEREIHWLKIDVEGWERAAIEGWRGARRPWVVVVEAIAPLTHEPTHAAWEPMLAEKGYRHVYSDGVNRFYLHADHADLAPRFDHGVGYLDHFVLSRTAPYCVYLDRGWTEAESRAEAQSRRAAEAEAREQALQQAAEASRTRLFALEIDLAETHGRIRSLTETLESALAREHRKTAEAAAREEELRVLVETGRERQRRQTLDAQARVLRERMATRRREAELRALRGRADAAEARLAAETAERARERDFLSAAAQAARRELDELRDSRSLRLTAPLRAAADAGRRARVAVKRAGSRAALGVLMRHRPKLTRVLASPGLRAYADKLARRFPSFRQRLKDAYHDNPPALAPRPDPAAAPMEGMNARQRAFMERVALRGWR